MNVRTASTPSVSSTPPVQASSSEAASTAGRGAPAAARASATPSDRLELSAQARAEAAGARRSDSPEVEAARVALRAGGGISAERLHDMRERVRTGHYDQPEAIDRIASAAVADFGGQG